MGSRQKGVSCRVENHEDAPLLEQERVGICIKGKVLALEGCFLLIFSRLLLAPFLHLFAKLRFVSIGRVGDVFAIFKVLLVENGSGC